MTSHDIHGKMLLFPSACLVQFCLNLSMQHGKLQALVYDILPSTTAVFSYAIVSGKLSANEQFCFVLFLVLKQQQIY